MDIQKPAIDIGIITNNLEPMLVFYRDCLGLEVEAVIDMPGGGVMHRLKAGDSIVKVIAPDPKPDASAPPGGIRGATGYRYWTLHVTELAARIDQLQAEGVEVVVPVKTIREGVTIAIVADPDGNWVELLHNAQA